MDHLKLTVDALSVDTISDLVMDNSCGAVSIFVGTTRDNFEDKKVLRLEYEAYEPMALKAMKSICEEVRQEWPAVHGIAIYHRLGNVPCREASVVIAVSSPHRRDSLDAVSRCIERLKSSVAIWKREVYEHGASWKENPECSTGPPPAPVDSVDKNLVQINVTPEELDKRIQNFIERKRDQVNISNIHDFLPGRGDEEETCARVKAQFVRRSDSKGHLKIRKVHNEWGPQTVQAEQKPVKQECGLPAAIAERVLAIEHYLNLGPVSPDIYKRLKAMEERIASLQAISPEYAHFWRNKGADSVKQEETADYTFSADDIARKIEQLERQAT
ncbi:molybdopterin synthase catalytic subunit [Pectinophora gossypiella]|nr:molybdopterin synthase catalytic subunit [Pectinophora gossypiella]